MTEHAWLITNVTVGSLAVSITILALVLVGPALIRELRAWMMEHLGTKPEPIDFQARRRELERTIGRSGGRKS